MEKANRLRKTKSFLNSGRILDLIIGLKVEDKDQEAAIKKAKYFVNLLVYMNI